MAAKTSDWRPGPTVCRCCLTEGCYKDISTEYFWMGKREVYAEMLSDSLNVSIAYSQSGGPNSNSRLICEPCISRLRDATDFKRQVLECEKTFMQYLDPGSSSVQKEMQLAMEEVKVEHVKKEKGDISDDDFDDRVDFVIENDDDDDDLDDEPLMKLASKEPKKEVDLLEILKNSQVTVKRKNPAKAKEPPAKKAKKQILIKPSASKPVAKASTASAPSKVEKKKKEETPNGIARRNATLLVQYTSAYPFRLPQSDVSCIVCSQEFQDPEEFRSHMKDDDHKLSQKLFRYMPTSQTIKLDITELSCRICDQIFDDINNIASHIATAHGVRDFNLKQELGVHPFRLYKDNNSCIFCSEKFVSIRALSRHMQTHYLKHTCETCGKSYGNIDALKVHATYAHINTKIICRKCKKTFDSREEKLKHLTSSQRCWMYVCNICAQRFMTRNHRIEHSQSEHNTDNYHPCPECCQVFTLKAKRQRHFIAAHTDKFKCSCCDKKFPTRKELKNHLTVHSAERQFQCDVCLKDFSTLKSLKQHLPIHMEIKPYKCMICNKQFNQRVSWKTHMSSYHPEIGKT